MNQTIGKTLGKLFQRVKYRSGKTRSPLSYNVMNPLANIRLAIEMLEAKNTDTDIMLYVEIIKRNCETINQLINEALPTEMPFIVQDKNPRIRTLVSQEY
jgi:nitrogen-specific signal transduction histidine kinase